MLPVGGKSQYRCITRTFGLCGDSTSQSAAEVGDSYSRSPSRHSMVAAVSVLVEEGGHPSIRWWWRRRYLMRLGRQGPVTVTGSTGIRCWDLGKISSV